MSNDAGSAGELAPRRLSAGAYFTWVAAVTAATFSVFAMLRPSLAHALRDTLGLEKPLPQSPQSFYSVRVAPILEQHCTACHGEHRQKSKLRLDSLNAALRGGKHGAVIEPGKVVTSALAQRISLPPGSERIMPPSSQAPLSADEATVIGLWIGAGASGTRLVGEFKTAPKPVARVTIAEVDPKALAAERAAIDAVLQALQQRYPGVIDYESRTSARLELDASLQGRAFGDRELAAFAPAATFIVRADLSGTAVSVASANAIIAMKNLRTLRIIDVRVGPALAAALATLRQQGIKVYADPADTEAIDGQH